MLILLILTMSDLFKKCFGESKLPTFCDVVKTICANVKFVYIAKIGKHHSVVRTRFCIFKPYAELSSLKNRSDGCQFSCFV